MPAAYALWSALTACLAGLATWAMLVTWKRWIRREERDLLRVLQKREMTARERTAAELHAAEALAASERRHRALTQAGATAVWQAATDGRITSMEGWDGLARASDDTTTLHLRSWLEAVASSDRERAAAAWREAVADGTPLDAEFRLMLRDGAERWCRARAVPVPPLEDRSGEWIGVIEDVDDRRRAEEARMLLAHEVNHRAKNMLAVIQAVVRMTHAPTLAEYKAAVTARVAALGRAHDLLSERDWKDVGLRDLVHGELAGYGGDGLASDRRVDIEGPPVRLAAQAVQPLAMVLHELAVNAAKYGAFSGPSGGAVTLRWTVEVGLVRLTWEERGGPRIDHEPGRQGFGTRVIDATVRDQLGGQVERRWSPQGLQCVLLLPLDRLGASDTTFC